MLEDKEIEKFEIPEKIYEKNLNGKILYIRHGETQFNKISGNIYAKEFIEAKSDINLIDCHLTNTGINQALKASQKLKDKNIEIVYVSPLIRTLETATYLLKEHPNKNNIIIKVHPFLNEMIVSLNNMKYKIEETKKLFNMNSIIKVDWTYFDEMYKNTKEQDTYFMNYLNNININEKNIVLQKLYDNIENLKFLKILSEMAKKNENILYESMEHCRKRVFSFKKFIKNKHDLNKDIDKKILIVAHGGIGKIITSKNCYRKNNLKFTNKDSLKLNNCEIISLYF